jgi:hypothetical protein
MTGTFSLVVFVALPLVALCGAFVYGWWRRNKKMPKVAPLPKDDDWN